MKINPPASSSSPTSRKKPRIMRHLISIAPKTQSAINGAAREIQPHQHLTGVLRRAFAFRGSPEGVDALKRALYKGANGGGRKPTPPVPWPPPASEHICFPRMAPSRIPLQHH